MDGAVSLVPMAADQVEPAARLHAVAFGEYSSTRLGGAFLRRYVGWYLADERRIAVAALAADGALLGYVLGAGPEQVDDLGRTLRLPAVTGLLRRPWLVADRRIRQRMWAAVAGAPAPQPPPLPAPTMLLGAIGVASAARGRGVGRQLVAAFEARSRQLGMRSLRLSVYPWNAAARRLYEACGWQAGEEPAAAGQSMFYFKILER